MPARSVVAHNNVGSVRHFPPGRSWFLLRALSLPTMIRAALWTPDESIKLDRGDPVTPAQRVDDTLDDRPIRLQHREHFVLRAFDDFGDAPGIHTGIQWYFAI